MKNILITSFLTLCLLSNSYTKTSNNEEGKKFHHRQHLSPSIILERRDLTKYKVTENDIVFLAKSPDVGYMLFIDNDIQSSQLDYHMYHEALVHPAMLSHPNPKRVMIGGGGEFLTACEILKHKSVERVDMIDIDDNLLEHIKKIYHDLHKDCWKDPRLNIIIDDVGEYIKTFKGPKYDVIIMDIVDPISTSAVIKLYSADFYKKIKADILDKNGVFGTHCSNLHLLSYKSAQNIRANVESAFQNAYVYKNEPPSFMESWAYLIAGNVDKNVKKGHGINELISKRGLESELRFYDEDAHVGMFGLPKDIRKIVYDDKIIPRTVEEYNGKWIHDNQD